MNSEDRVNAVAALSPEEYNTVEGISQYLDSLERFRFILDERRRAGYKRKERLECFLLLGRYYLDSCGNVGDAQEFVPGEHIDMPDIVTMDRAHELIHEYDKELHPDVLTEEEIHSDEFNWSENTRPFPTRVSYAIRDTIPDARIKCAHCGETWYVDNCHDVIPVSGDEVFPGKPYIGKTLEEVIKIFEQKDDAEYSVYRERSIRNDKYIDLTPKKDYPTLKENERGWIEAGPEHIIEEGDEIYVQFRKFYHHECKVESTKARCQKIFDGEEDYNRIRNLAGAYECDPYIQMELFKAGIPIIEVKAERGEVPYNFEGQLGDGQFKFTRAWSYWIVTGKVPLPIARTMYNNKEGKKYVRVSGHCGCPPPDDWCDHYAEDGRMLASLKELEKYPEEKRQEIIDKTAEKIEWTDDPSKGVGYVETYHIDSLNGLKLFADSVKPIVEGEPNNIVEVSWLSK